MGKTPENNSVDPSFLEFLVEEGCQLALLAAEEHKIGGRQVIGAIIEVRAKLLAELPALQNPDNYPVVDLRKEGSQLLKVFQNSIQELNHPYLQAVNEIVIAQKHKLNELSKSTDPSVVMDQRYKKALNPNEEVIQKYKKDLLSAQGFYSPFAKGLNKSLLAERDDLNWLMAKVDMIDLSSLSSLVKEHEDKINALTRESKLYINLIQSAAIEGIQILEVMTSFYDKALISLNDSGIEQNELVRDTQIEILEFNLQKESSMVRVLNQTTTLQQDLDDLKKILLRRQKSIETNHNDSKLYSPSIPKYEAAPKETVECPKKAVQNPQSFSISASPYQKEWASLDSDQRDEVVYQLVLMCNANQLNMSFESWPIYEILTECYVSDITFEEFSTCLSRISASLEGVVILGPEPALEDIEKNLKEEQLSLKVVRFMTPVNSEKVSQGIPLNLDDISYRYCPNKLVSHQFSTLLTVLQYSLIMNLRDSRLHGVEEEEISRIEECRKRLNPPLPKIFEA